MTLPENRRMELDAVLRCPHCKDVPFRVFRRQNLRPDGALAESFQHVLWPAPEHHYTDPPLHPQHICCPDCGEELKREAP